MTELNIRISQLRVDLSIIGRKQLSEDAVTRYMDLIESGWKKPILVQEGTNLVVDGAHRLEAYKRLNKQWIPCSMRDIPDDDLRLTAIECNQKHGVPYTIEERNQSIVNLYFRDGKTQREIADKVHLSRQRVGQIVSNANVCDANGDKRRKLTMDEERVIVQLLRGREKQRVIAERFNISRSRVSQIRRKYLSKEQRGRRSDGVLRSLPLNGFAQDMDSRRLRRVENLHDRVEGLEADWCLKTWDTGKLHRIYHLINSMIPKLGSVSVRIWRKVKENDEIDFGLDEYTIAIEEHSKLRAKAERLERRLKTPESELKEKVGELMKDGGKTAMELMAWADDHEIERRRVGEVLKELMRQNMVCRDGERYVSVI